MNLRASFQAKARKILAEVDRLNKEESARPVLLCCARLAQLFRFTHRFSVRRMLRSNRRVGPLLTPTPAGFQLNVHLDW